MRSRGNSLCSWRLHFIGRWNILLETGGTGICLFLNRLAGIIIVSIFMMVCGALLRSVSCFLIGRLFMCLNALTCCFSLLRSLCLVTGWLARPREVTWTKGCIMWCKSHRTVSVPSIHRKMQTSTAEWWKSCFCKKSTKSSHWFLCNSTFHARAATSTWPMRQLQPFVRVKDDSRQLLSST